MSAGVSGVHRGDEKAANLAQVVGGSLEWRREGFLVTTDPARFDLDVIHGYLHRSYWAEGIPRETVERSLRNSLGFALIAQDGQGGTPGQVGFARVVSDRATFAWLADVFVLEEWRGRGLSKWLVACVLDHPELQGLRRFTLGTRDAHGLYARFGFAALAEPTRAMEIVKPDVYRATAGDARVANGERAEGSAR
ncbi:MAG: GNAT family N-acetyltransferase [Vicinamibacteria bacterium]